MPPVEKKIKLYRISIDTSDYYATGEDAHAAYARIVAHDEKEGSYTHMDNLSRSVEAELVDLEKLPLFAAWAL